MQIDVTGEGDRPPFNVSQNKLNASYRRQLEISSLTILPLATRHTSHQPHVQTWEESVV